MSEEALLMRYLLLVLALLFLVGCQSDQPVEQEPDRTTVYILPEFVDMANGDVYTIFPMPRLGIDLPDGGDLYTVDRLQITFRGENITSSVLSMLEKNEAQLGDTIHMVVSDSEGYILAELVSTEPLEFRVLDSPYLIDTQLP